MKQSSLARRACGCAAALGALPAVRLEGRVTALSGLVIDVAGLAGHLSVGARLLLCARDGRRVAAEIVGFRHGQAQAMPFAPLDGIGPGSAALACGDGLAFGTPGTLAVTDGWLGRVLDPLGQPLDGAGPLPRGRQLRRLRAAPPQAALRARLGPRIDLGVRALNCFATCREGQRLGLFAGSGVGKSTLLAMLARHTACDVAVLALVGERGREVRDFLEDDLGAAGLARSVVVVATSDAPPLLRREAAYAAMTVAEHFRDQGKSVLLMMDSVTRFCLALREIGLSAGEPPATRGYPPSVFAELPRLLERAGPGMAEPGMAEPGMAKPDMAGPGMAGPGMAGPGMAEPVRCGGPVGGAAGGPDAAGRAGQITALFTVLVEGDDHNEPVADAVRGILDGHVILDRRIAEGGRYPAVDVLRSLSRTAPGCLEPAEAALVARARALLALHADMADLVRLGAYRAGADPAVDEAVALAPRIEQVLRQGKAECGGLADGFARLRAGLTPDAAGC